MAAMDTIVRSASAVQPDCPHPTADDRLWWSYQNADAHDAGERPRFVVQYLPCTNGASWGPWCVVETAEDTIVNSFSEARWAVRALIDLDTPEDVWRERWEAWADTLPTEPPDWY
jgi:hypothetical protein